MTDVKNNRLSVVDHDRDSANMRYMYPVVSRRARGVSLGINLNPNNACNFRCIYCQVPDLRFGKGPEIDLTLFEQEFRSLLNLLTSDAFMKERVPEGSRRLSDVAFSGNGEPTSSPQFGECVDIVECTLAEYPALQDLKRVVITNGTLTDRAPVEAALQRLTQHHGEIWFKLDSATPEGTARINSNTGDLEQRLRRLRRVSEICPTWIQSCWFRLDGADPSPRERTAFVSLMRELADERCAVQGVLLYGLARPSLQPEAPRLEPLPEQWFQQFSEEIQGVGMPVRVSV